MDDPYSGRGIYLCGYLDLPLDYSNSSDERVTRLAVTKFQVSGLARITTRSDPRGTSKSPAGRKSERTIVIEPGGPGASGTREVWQEAEGLTERFSSGQFDVLGWDPRGVNTSLPSLACFPHDSYRDHWTLRSWPDAAQILFELEAGNATLATALIERSWHDPTVSHPPRTPSSAELPWLVICADAYDVPQPDDGLLWWDRLWTNMTARSWISGSVQLTNVLQCRHFNHYWPNPPGVYRGDLNHTLSNPVLLISGTHDPATPLNNARKLLGEMGPNAQLVVHHGLERIGQTVQILLGRHT